MPWSLLVEMETSWVVVLTLSSSILDFRQLMDTSFSKVSSFNCRIYLSVAHFSFLLSSKCDFRTKMFPSLELISYFLALMS